MQYIIDHAEEIEKLVKVKAQVSEIKSIMLDNIDKVFNLFSRLSIVQSVWIHVYYVSHVELL